MANGELSASFEGLDGAGKSTLATRLAEHYRSLGYSVVSLASPSRTPEGFELRRRLMELTSDEKDAAFAADIRESQRAIPAGTDLALWDRHLDSTYTSNRDATLHGMAAMAADLRMPDVTCYLRLSPADAFDRAAPITDHPLDEEWLEMKYGRYEELAREYPDRIQVIDAMQSPDEVFYQAAEVIGKHL